MIRILALYLDFEGAKNVHVLFVLNWGFGGCWRFLTGYGIIILIWIQSSVFDTTMILIFALYFDSKGVKNIYVLKVLIWGFGGCWRFLTGFCNLDHDSDRSSNLAWIYLEVLITPRSVKAQIQSAQ